MNSLHLTHILFPLFLGFIYIYFIVYLNHIHYLSFLLIAIFLVFFFFFALATYALFHHRPGHQTYNTSENKIGVEKIGLYKQNQERKNQLLMLMKENITYERLRTLEKQIKIKSSEYLLLYREPSFCDICEVIRSPRTYHCKECDKCILRREKHSELIDNCIGEKNMKIFMQYLFIGLVQSLYMTLSLILVTVLEHHKLDDFNDLELILFALIEMSLGAAVLLFGKEFFISYWNAIENITETERKEGVITKKNNPFKNQKYYEGLFKSTIEYLKLGQIADPNNWLELQEEN